MDISMFRKAKENARTQCKRNNSPNSGAKP